MRYDFDTVIDRRGTYSTQWDYAADRFGRADVLPFSISDTDFAVPDEVRTALASRLEHPVFGYTRWNHEDYKRSIAGWFERRGGATVQEEWVVYSPSVVFSIAELIRMMSEPGDNVVVFNPMYDAFFGMIEKNGRSLLPVGISSANEGYKVDWSALEEALVRPESRVLLLTNPHNPTGKVFSRDELFHMASLASKHDVFLISDDIHRDIVYMPNKYTPVTEMSTSGVALCCSGSKTFNTPGLGGSYVLIPEAGVRERFLISLKQRNALSSANIFGMIAQMTAYNACDDYVDELVSYLDGNLALIESYLKENLPKIRFTHPQGTYLAWMDVSELGLSTEEMQQRLVREGVGIMSGETYGDNHFLRMNVACPRSKVVEGLHRMRRGCVRRDAE